MCVCVCVCVCAHTSRTIELNSFGEYNVFAQAKIVLVLPVPGGP